VGGVEPLCTRLEALNLEAEVRCGLAQELCGLQDGEAPPVQGAGGAGSPTTFP
jgi:hypothetical protein